MDRIIILITSGFILHERGYREGQIDSINGVMKYKLIENPDKSREWILK